MHWTVSNPKQVDLEKEREKYLRMFVNDNDDQEQHYSNPFER